MVYNKEHNRWVSKDGLVFRYDKKKDKLVLCNQHKTNKGYFYVWTDIQNKAVHRLVYETFVGKIPTGFEIDHINADKSDNRLCNLRCVTHIVNMQNNHTRPKLGRKLQNFGKIMFEHYGITRKDNIKLYDKERYCVRRYGKFSWE